MFFILNRMITYCTLCNEKFFTILDFFKEDISAFNAEIDKNFVIHFLHIVYHSIIMPKSKSGAPSNDSK